MRPIGDFAMLSERSLGNYLSTSPPAVLIHDSASGAFHSDAVQDRRTISRQEYAFKSEVTPEAPGLPRELAFMVIPLVSRHGKGRNQLVVGRAETCDIVIGDLSISREHARIDRTDDSYVIEDLGSRVGTTVGGQILEPGTSRPLSPGQHVSLGTVEFTFLDAAAFYHFVKRFLGD